MAKKEPTETTEAPRGPVPNIIWVGDGEPPHTITIGMSEPIRLVESEAEQRAGFYHARAGELIAALRPDYKEFRTRARAEAIVGVGTDRPEQTAEDVLGADGRPKPVGVKE